LQKDKNINYKTKIINNKNNTLNKIFFKIRNLNLNLKIRNFNSNLNINILNINKNNFNKTFLKY